MMINPCKLSSLARYPSGFSFVHFTSLYSFYTTVSVIDVVYRFSDCPNQRIISTNSNNAQRPISIKIPLDMPTTINALFAIAAIVLFVVWKYRDRAIGTRQRKDLVGPPEWPILGSLPWLLRDGEHMLEMFVEMRQKYGQFSTFTVPGFRSIDVSRPDLIEFVQKTKFNHFAKGEYQNNKMRMLLGRGIFATDNEEWYKQRKITSQIFTNEQFRGIITSSVSV